MAIFSEIENRDHEQIVFCSDKEAGLRAIISIHDTTLGPSLGGCRMWNYNNEEEALRDVLRLSRGMTYKASIAGLNLGGGKAVIIGNSKTDKNELLFRTFGRFIEGLGGRYITAEDVGTSVRDMEWVRMETKYVTGIAQAHGGSGDPSPVTGLGVFTGMKACAKRVYGSDSLAGKKISVQGLGHVGQNLVERLVRDGATVYVTDIDEEKVSEVVKEYDVEVVDTDDIYGLDVDIFSPCALGGVINDDTIPQLKCDIVAGAANNQLEDESKHGHVLKENGILYAPDYAINAGGLINVYNELEGYNLKRALRQAEGIYDILNDIFDRAEAEDIPTHFASNRVAEDRINNIGRINNIYIGHPTGINIETSNRR
ncbi:MAG: leucine dehydrogenase [Candidatus Marinimicrobia bacterium]|nr:leucine dehydrogenase [Candidatus Neomarinimicrobiota bacterium]MCF7829909.1 leucine dehydrogenase [Candidatus Neomarinimicrobiota bacterium]MCF7879128.1 leucine dehydrogenase [Candidatus Neomarinimicrobiota bacterium]